MSSLAVHRLAALLPEARGITTDLEHLFKMDLDALEHEPGLNAMMGDGQPFVRQAEHVRRASSKARTLARRAARAAKGR